MVAVVALMEEEEELAVDDGDDLASNCRVRDALD